MISPKEALYVGIDLGGSSFRIGLVNGGGEIVAHDCFPTRVSRGHLKIIEEMVDRSVRLWRQQGFSGEQIAGVGVGSPGPLDPGSGVVIVAPNLGWENVPLRDLLEERFEKTVTVDNDAVAATFGEWWVGAGSPYQDVIGLTVGTGVGGGIILGGAVHYGFQGTSGHIGHMVIEAGGRLCGCGNRGCLEAYASATVMVKRALEYVAEDEPSTLGNIKDGLTARDIWKGARRGDKLSLRIFDEAAYYLALGVNNVLNVLNPQAVIVMGAVANAGPLLLNPLSSHVRSLAFPRVWEETRILRGSLGELAGMVGAAGLIRRP